MQPHQLRILVVARTLVSSDDAGAMPHSQAVFRLRDQLFLVRTRVAVAAGTGFEGQALRIIDDRLERVHLADGTPLASSAPSAWQASFRMVNLLETYVGARAEELRGFDINPYREEGTWHVPA